MKQTSLRFSANYQKQRHRVLLVTVIRHAVSWFTSSNTASNCLTCRCLQGDASATSFHPQNDCVTCQSVVVGCTGWLSLQPASSGRPSSKHWQWTHAPDGTVKSCWLWLLITQSLQCTLMLIAKVPLVTGYKAPMSPYAFTSPYLYTLYVDWNIEGPANYWHMTNYTTGH